MPRTQRVVSFTAKGRKAWEDFVSHGEKSARAITRARTLVLSDEGKKEHEVAKLLGVARGTIYNPRKLTRGHQKRVSSGLAHLTLSNCSKNFL
jgi:putative transposase